MIDINDITYLSSESYLEQVREITAEVRDLVNDIELLTDKYVSDRYMNQQELAQYLHCTVQQIPREIPSVHIGRTYLFRASDVDKFMNKHRKRRDEEQ